MDVCRRACVRGMARIPMMPVGDAHSERPGRLLSTGVCGFTRLHTRESEDINKPRWRLTELAVRPQSTRIAASSIAIARNAALGPRNTPAITNATDGCEDAVKKRRARRTQHV